MTTITLPKLYQWQADVFIGVKQHWKDSIHVVKSRRQCGKSILAELIGMYYCIQNKNFRCYIISPTFNQADKMLVEIWKMCKGQPFYFKKNDVKRQIIFRNGAEIRLFSAEQGVDALQGYTCELLIIDEAAYLSEDIIDAVMPYVNTTKGPIIMFSTPRTKSGQFYNYYSMGMSQELNNIYGYDWTKYDVSELLSPAKLELYRKTVDRLKFKTYYLGEFLNNESDFFGDFSQCVKDKPNICFEQVVFGIDWAGATGGDYTAISIIGMSGQLYDIKYFNDKDPKQTIAEILRLVAQYKPKKVTVETNSIGNIYFGLLRDELKMRNIQLVGFYTDNNSKDKIISKLQIAFQNNKITIYSDYELMDELQYYELTYSKTGKRVFNAKAGHHDDLIMSLAIAYNSLTAGNYAVY